MTEPTKQRSTCGLLNVLACLAVLLSCGCKKEPTGETKLDTPAGKGDGLLRGVRYHVDLQGSYSMVQRTEHEQVWIPSTDDRPFIAIQVAPRPRNGDGAVIPCAPGEDGGGTSYGGFFLVRKGDSVALQTAPPPHGVIVTEHRCLPPGENALTCSASYPDGEMPSDREHLARAACKSVAAR
jgi:hypothetical protein